MKYNKLQIIRDHSPPLQTIKILKQNKYENENRNLSFNTYYYHYPRTNY